MGKFFIAMGKCFVASRASNSIVNDQDFMPVLVTCQFDEDTIKIECTIDLTRSNIGFFGTQVQVTPKSIWPDFELIQDFILAVLVTCKFDEDPIKSEVAILRTFSPL